ncbi:MAG TPA: 4Fe-4S cluster-binding domain-containing protein [Anaerolineae bacterium]|nr:4Fe-4S cluster-binding domain-containing protein [Anaerolineae bacterium]HQK12926.1 4Fe-4S cluster-binding domain-containing protein [Anaerolineae bacterium]
MRSDECVFPIYLAFLESHTLSRRVAEAEAALHDCHLCGNDCGIDRTQRPGPCRIGAIAYIASYGPHHGEEDVLRGRYGSGTIFFSGCNLHCQYCQNDDISQHVVGQPVTPQSLAAMMLDLEQQGCHNINLVSPTHVVPQIVMGLAVAIRAGLRLPVVYNTGGYDAPQALQLMDGLIDIYMPDMKYSDAAIAQQLSLVRDYPAVNRAAVKEMHRQVGDLIVDEHGIARRGLLVRHLVLPGGLAGTAEVARFLAEEVSRDTYINVMAQYHPAYKARQCASDTMPLDRRVTPAEYADAVQQAREAGLHRFDERRWHF